MQYDTNQNFKLTIKRRNDTYIAINQSPEGYDTLLDIENYIGVLPFNFARNSTLIINKKIYTVHSATQEFIENKPVLTIYVLW